MISGRPFQLPPFYDLKMYNTTVKQQSLNSHHSCIKTSVSVHQRPGTSSQQCIRAMASDSRIMLSNCRTVILQDDLVTPEPSRCRRRLYCSTMKSSDSLDIFVTEGNVTVSHATSTKVHSSCIRLTVPRLFYTTYCFPLKQSMLYTYQRQATIILR